MFLKGSRYAAARKFQPPDGGPDFLGVRAREITAAPGVLEHTVQAGDRLDRLARHYYNDDRLWWRIVDANPEYFYGPDLVRESADKIEVGTSSLNLNRMVGLAILIPRAR